MIRGIVGFGFICLTTVMGWNAMAQSQPSSNPMRRLLQRDPVVTPAPRPTATPASNASRGSRSEGFNSTARTPRQRVSQTNADGTPEPGTARINRRAAAAGRTPRPTPDPNALLVKSANDATTVVARFLQNANDGKYSQARALLTPEVQKYFDSEYAAVHGDLMAVLDGLTKDGQLSVIRYPLANVRGEGITVQADMQYRDGTNREHRFRVVQSGSNYRIALDLSARVHVAEPIAAPTVVNSGSSAASKPSEGKPLVSSASEDILTGSGVVTRPENPTPTPTTTRPRLPRDEPAAVVTTEGETTAIPSTNAGDTPTIQDKPWQPAPASTPNP